MKTLNMTFVSEVGDKVNLSINGVKDTITAADVKTVMDTIIAKNVFNSAGGDLKSRYSAQLSERTTEKLEVLM